MTSYHYAGSPQRSRKKNTMTNPTGLQILGSGRSIPSRIFTNDDLKQYMETDDEWIYSRTGIRKRHFCDPQKGENALTMAAEAARQAMIRTSEMDPAFSQDRIGAVLVTSCSPDYALPSTAALLQKELGLSEQVLAYDLNAACSGFVYGLITGYGLMQAGLCRYVLLVGSEHLSGKLDLTDRGTGILFGDGAGAAVIRLSAQADAMPFTANAFSDGNIPSIFCKNVGKGTPFGQTSSPGVIAMDGRAVFRFALHAIQQSLDNLLAESGLTPDGIDAILCHQANARILESIMKRYPGYEDKFLIDIEEYGNTSSASIPILLQEKREQGILKPGMKVLMIGFGAGLSWGGAAVNI